VSLTHEEILPHIVVHTGGKFSAGIYGAGGQFAGAGFICTVPLNNSAYNGFEIVLP
jgi:hypothetical protein